MEARDFVRRSSVRGSNGRISLRFLEQVEESVLVFAVDLEPVQLALELVGGRAVLLGLLEQPLDSLPVFAADPLFLGRSRAARLLRLPPALPRPAAPAASLVASAPAARRAFGPSRSLARKAR